MAGRSDSPEGSGEARASFDLEQHLWEIGLESAPRCAQAV